MKVIKRNGRTEELDVSKIKKCTFDAIKDLEGVNLSELELDAKIQFRDGISTEEIQKTLIKTAVDKIDIDCPNWTFVAARLFLFDLYKKVNGMNRYNHLREYFEKGE
ncbi:ribonucleoside-diphosphate reductase subunit alpha, partial [Campylobacter jejuni]